MATIGYVTIPYGQNEGVAPGGAFYLWVYSSTPGYLGDEAAAVTWPALSFAPNTLTKFGPFSFDMWQGSSKGDLIFGAYLTADDAEAYAIRLIPEFILAERK